MKQQIIDALFAILEEKLPKSDIERLIEVPPQEALGDFAFPCFPLAKTLRKSPVQIAAELAQKFSQSVLFSKVVPVSGYLNFFVNKQQLAGQVLLASPREEYGKKSEKRWIVIEFSSPNTNKPLHLGHLRNISIGESVSRILQFCGNTVIRTCINNDRGVHICKSMLAYKQFGEGRTPQSEGKKSDHFVGDYYVKFSQEAAKDESWNERAQEMLVKWENGDAETIELWKKMNEWAHDGFWSTYRLLGINFDKEYFESKIYKNGKEIVIDGLAKGIFKKRADGAIFADLSDEKLGEKVLLRPDGTSVYIVQDLYLAVLKNEEFTYDQSIYVVGNEQEHHFKMLKSLFKQLQYPIGERMVHLSYGMVELPEGKMKSREGTVVDTDDLVRETANLAQEEIRERYTLDETAMQERSLKIALAAIKYQLLKIDITKNMVFDPKKAISFEGDTGPYLLYSYARASSILRKSQLQAGAEIPELEPSEARLIKRIASFPEIIEHARNRLSPSVVATYAFDLAQTFNEFYHACQVIGHESEGFRIQLVKSVRSVLKKCLWLLGIDEIEEM